MHKSFLLPCVLKCRGLEGVGKESSSAFKVGECRNVATAVPRSSRAADMPSKKTTDQGLVTWVT